MDEHMLFILDSADTFKQEKRKFEIEYLGELNKGKLIYFIEASTAISGFGALMRRTISGLYIADILNAIPVVSWIESPIVNAGREINGSINPFEYFYNPISEVTRESALESQRVIKHTIANDSCLWYAGRLASVDGQTERYIEISRRLVKKYNISLKNEVQEALNDDMSNVIQPNTLGVHMRGAQRKRAIQGLANPIPVEWYFETIDSVLKTDKYNRIFLATDDQNYLDKMKEKYGSLICYYDDVARYSNGIIPYFSKENDTYRMTYEIIRDIYTLIACDSLVGGPSNVTSIARVLKNGSEWKQCIILDNGVCTDGEANLENTLNIINCGGDLRVLER